MKFQNNPSKFVIPALKVILFLLLAYFPLFLHLDVLPIRIWDEARLANNAYEMYKNGNYLVTNYNGVADVWNTKPPLLIWFQVFWFKIIGPSVLAIRLPTAIAGLLTAVALILFSLKYLKSYFFGFIASLILLTSYGYIHIHVARTGDYDALLTFFTTVYCLSFFLFIKNLSRWYLLFFFIALTLSVLTKSIQGLLFLPALLIYLLTTKNLKMLKNKWVVTGSFVCLAIIAGHYCAREFYNPGYLMAVWENELGGRYASTLEGHKHPFMFYFNHLVTSRFATWYWLVSIGIAIGILSLNNKLRSLTGYTVLLATVYLLIISYSETKLEWYNAPLFPFLAIIAATPIYWVFNLLKYLPVNLVQLKYNILPITFLFITFLHPYEKIIEKVYQPKEENWDRDIHQISHFLQNAVKGKYDIRRHTICFTGYNAHVLFYARLLSEKGKKIAFSNCNSLLKGDLAVASQQHIQRFIEEHYSYTITYQYNNVKVYQIQ